MIPEGRQIFLENKLNFLKGQSKKVKHFAERSFASLATPEVSSKLRGEIVEQSKALCEDYIYHRLAAMLHLQQERYIEQIVNKSGPEHQNSTTPDSPLEPSDNISDFSEIPATPVDPVDIDQNGSSSGRSISRLFSRYPMGSSDDVFFQSSPDKAGMARFEKWRNSLPEASAEILELGQRLERSYPYLYDNLSAQLKMPFRSEAAVTRALTCIGDSMFENSFVTWYRVVAFFAVAGAVALEVVDNHKGDLIAPLVQVFSQVIDRHVALWVCKQGGWIAIIPDYQPVDKKYQQFLKILGFILGFVVILFLVPVRFFDID